MMRRSKKNHTETNDPKLTVAVEVPSERICQLYETLRGWVLGRPTVQYPSAPQLGFGVLLRRGMCTWIDTCCNLSDVVKPQPEPLSPFPGSPPCSVQAQLAALLAHTLIQYHQGATR